ncbi:MULTISPECIES: DUF5329 domain-containing protein [unclassified Lentimonas]|uniref:DUF5329 family protein n=1 Tax=unclassified Lentimonas TaxID=2630993 RepID=UPI001322C87B|nr:MULTISPECIES: DUF5329 domain-containing protein [unclassified Lentimonas]CAA6677835.1 Unannotated [Lentimonas sp. CC4]CAA6683937.1 Unannotated [Lentimonas sp. CC6]CAA6689963.1 Unannotated [Lentimonas sp. CC10]CAA6691039.1 Unannotated [Lentimonas sp. CC19]CAA7069347.1 Unannotated [Lentimonas sp. CC11]
MNRFKTLLAIVLLSLSLGNWLNAAKPSAAAAQEIQQLIEAVEQSGCTFERNGKTYTAQEGADHMRLKLKRGGKYADTTEHFITRLASKSSWSGKPYHIIEPNGDQRTMQVWLEAQLVLIRKTQ